MSKKDVLGEAVRTLVSVPGEMLGTLKDLLEKLTGPDSCWWFLALKKFLRKENPFEVPMDTDSQLKRWQTLYKEWFGIELDITSLTIPERRLGFDRLIVVVGGITLNGVVDTMRKRFSVVKYAEDLDKAVPTNDRVNDHTYVIWERDRVESDEEHANKSAEDLVEAGISGQTLLERLLQECIFYFEHVKHPQSLHLDVQNVTLCAGSRYNVDRVPCVHWNADYRWLLMGACGERHRDGDIRTREVIAA